ncbi:GMC oxidoreductase [Saccharothrix variisporea]|uniref:Choline dehydrogenase-like flavoprotein n=1 Tax=Saccharothrix variisporea TaxID=543527 RepID=A0A495XMX1_9PSEU|nr:GMC oxidoreductase [Saccharothrix variisporea]RKT74979.1 choline dehydrogenase-like flavoprotein [Saccharothrix variisporea]
MFVVRFHTNEFVPDDVVALRSGVDGWTVDVPGVYEDGAWTFRLDEARYGPLLEFKFVLDGTTWMDGPNLVAQPTAGGVRDFADEVAFTPLPAVVVENGEVQQRFFRPDHDGQRVYDVIVVGSGIGGGLLADQLSDAGADVLVLEAGSLLFPTHVANLPRRLRVGKFDKHVWGLFQDFGVRNYANVDGSDFRGAQAFNLGGRSVFWGGLIPRMGAWELSGWPAAVREYLLTTGYRVAEDALNRSTPIGSTYQEEAKRALTRLLPDFDHLDAPVAVQYRGYTTLSIPAGMFSTADLLSEDRLVVDPGRSVPTINLNHAVQRVLTRDGRAVGVSAYDLLARKQREYRADTVVLCAGTIESAKIALLSGLTDPTGLIGRGITDHPIWYTHFSLPAGSPHAAVDASAKLWSRHRGTTVDLHPYNVVLELGADFNQGRYVDPDNLARHRQRKADSTLGEIVFLFNAPLVATNEVRVVGPPAVPVQVVVRPCPLAPALVAEVRDIAATVLEGIGAEPITGETLDLTRADLGGVAHEVGTLRMGEDGGGVVDADLKFLAYENLYACDNSVLPSSPAANPTLTLAALSLRLARHLTT